MKIVFLNTWNGKIVEGITEFVREQSRDTDIFCFQEVHAEMRPICQNILTDYEEFFAFKTIEGIDYAQATYVHKKIKVIEIVEALNERTGCGFGLNVKITIDGQIFNVCNFHGMPFPGDKLDNPDRLRQSQGLLDFFKDTTDAKIIGGDFNMLPDTQSMRMFAKNGYRDLIDEFKIKTTRNRLNWEKYPGDPQFFADFVFLSPDVKLNNFTVVNNEVSDHLPMILEIEA